jgi:hypothetical protein
MKCSLYTRLLNVRGTASFMSQNIQPDQWVILVLPNEHTKIIHLKDSM